MFFPISYSTLSDLALNEYIKKNYNLDQVKNTTYLLRGMNDTYLVTTSDESYIFRVYRGDRRQEYSEIAFELELLCYLDRKGVSVSLPIADVKGEYIQAFEAPEGTRFGVLFTFAEGHEKGMDNSEISYSFGQAVANIHLLTDHYESGYERTPIDLDFLLHQSLAIIESNMQHRGEDVQFLKKLGLQMEQSLREIPLEQLDFGICHGDLHGNTNVSFTEELVMTHYDFDLCGYGWRAYDIAEFRLAREVRLGHDPDQLERIWGAFLEGYQSIRVLSENDLKAVPIFVGIRQLWLMGLCLKDPHIHGAIDFGDDFIDDKLAYFKQLEERLYGERSGVLQ